MKKRALITGVSGQDGAYLALKLLDKGYEVHGAVRRASVGNLWRLEELGIAGHVKLVPLELSDLSNITDTLRALRPGVVFNLAAQSYVAASFDQPLFTADVTGLAVLRLLEAIRLVDPEIRFYQSSSSEMFGAAEKAPQTEETPFRPRNPYGVAKMYAHWMTVNYREAHGLHAAAGILFNHESPLRGMEFVTRKIAHGFAERRHSGSRKLELGNLETMRDFGHARDYVDGIYDIAMHETPEDFVLATGKSHSVRTFVTMAAEAAGFALEWEGGGEKTRAFDRRSGEEVVRVNPALFRPVEIQGHVGDARKARARLNWRPRTGLHQMVEEMVAADYNRIVRNLPFH